VRAGPLRRPPVDLTLGAVAPLDADGDRDGVEAVADVETFDLAAPLVGGMLDGLTVHSYSVEQMFDAWKRFSERLTYGGGRS
jgi:hypothetical protein